MNKIQKVNWVLFGIIIAFSYLILMHSFSQYLENSHIKTQGTVKPVSMISQNGNNIIFLNTKGVHHINFLYIQHTEDIANVSKEVVGDNICLNFDGHASTTLRVNKNEYGGTYCDMFYPIDFPFGLEKK